ncbi:MAG: tRNA pseudouridine(55) synthase TruB [Peptostreptococcaceae bacterium]
MDKIVSIIKPNGMTSHDVVSVVRKTLNMKKVGHTGTLDPDASGVLPICLGKATKVSELILNKDKAYICELTLGLITDTYDTSGEILERCEDFELTKEQIKEAFKTQLGEIDQFPPIYSALKVNGRKMCDLARSGKADQIELKSRRINIKKLDILSINKDKVSFYVECSKGTYVRSICYDIGKILGVGGCMSNLIRVKSGKFNMDNSISIEDLKKHKEENTLDKYIYDIEFVLSDFNTLVLHENAVRYYKNGGSILDDRFIEKTFNDNDEIVRVYDNEKNFIGSGKLLRKDNTISVKTDKIFVV